MKSISHQKLFELYKATIRCCGIYLLHEDDEKIGYNIFEEFDTGVISFLHADNLVILVDNGFLNTYQMQQSTVIREKALKLQQDGLWKPDIVKHDKRWRELMELCDELQSTLQ